MSNLFGNVEFLNESSSVERYYKKEECGIFESCEFLNESQKSRSTVRLLFSKALGMLKGKDWTIGEINKMIKEIESCNKKIDAYNRNQSVSNSQKLMYDKSYQKRVVEECCWWMTGAFATGFGIGALGKALGVSGGVVELISIIAGVLLGVDYTFNRSISNPTKDKEGNVDRFFGKLENENNKALKYLYAERKKLQSER